ncbi:MAG: LCP family protein, partial [Acidimicrobiales bacterium]
GLNVPSSGCHHLNGFEALSVVRSRYLYYETSSGWHYDGMGDLSRIQRDHEFLRVVAAGVEHQITNPLKLNGILGSLIPDFQLDSKFTLGELINLGTTFHSVRPSSIPTETLPVYVDNNPLTYRGSSLGDVVFPVEPNDLQVIHQMLGLPIPAVSPGTTVSVLNGSGASNQATDVSSQLAQLGLHITTVGDTPVASQPAETVVYYSPGHQAQGLAVLNHLAGNVVMGQRSLPAGTDVQVVTGTYLNVVGLPSSSSGGSPAGSSSTATSTTTAPPASANPVPSADTTTASSSLPSWDPRGCPAGMPVTPIG